MATELALAKQSMNKTISILRERTTGIDNNVNDILVSTVFVSINGQKTALKELSAINQNTKTRTISIIPYDRTMLPEITKELIRQGFDAYQFSPTNISVNIPLPSGENYKKVLAHIKSLGEEAKVAIRNIRRKYMKKCDREELQKVTDNSINRIDEIIKRT